MTRIMHSLTAAALSLCLTVPAHAGGGVPTFDGMSVAELQSLIGEAKLQLKEAIAGNLKLDEQTLKMIEQIALMERQLSALQDGLTLADLGVSSDFLKEIMPQISDLGAQTDKARAGKWDEVISGGKLGGQPVSNAVDDLFASAGLKRERVDQLASSENTAAARIGTGANTSAFLSVAAEASAEDAKESLERVDGLVKDIPDTKNLKAAVDLNTRVTAELAIALANIWSMEAAQTVGMGQMGVMDAATLADEVKFLDLTGDKK